MINISQKVEDIVRESSFAQEGMQTGLLNLSQYAQVIHAEVEERCKKDVKVGTIIVSLNRLQKKLRESPSLLLPTFRVQETYIHNDLLEWVITKNVVAHEILGKLAKRAQKDPSGITITQGVHEMTIIAHNKYSEWIKKSFPKKSVVSVVANLSSVTLKVATTYTQTPNIFYILFRALAAQNINVIEIFSTSSEISILISTESISPLMLALSSFKA